MQGPSSTTKTVTPSGRRLVALCLLTAVALLSQQASAATAKKTNKPPPPKKTTTTTVAAQIGPLPPGVGKPAPSQLQAITPLIYAWRVRLKVPPPPTYSVTVPTCMPTGLEFMVSPPPPSHGDLQSEWARGQGPL